MQGTRGSQSNSGPLGICQRLFNFFMNSLVGRGLKRVTLGSMSDHTVRSGSNEVFLEDGSPRIGDQEAPVRPEVQVGDQVRSNVHSSSEIIVDFRHNDGEMEKWSTTTSVHNLGNDLQKGIAVDKRRNKETGQGSRNLPGIIPESDLQDLESTKKTVIITQGAEKREGSKSLSDRTLSSTERLILAMEQEDKIKPPRRVRPLLSVASNINEKSDAFIRSRKEAMIRNLQPEAQ